MNTNKQRAVPRLRKLQSKMKRHFVAWYLLLLIAALSACSKSPASNEARQTGVEPASATPSPTPAPEAPRPSGPIEFTEVQLKPGYTSSTTVAPSAKNICP